MPWIETPLHRLFGAELKNSVPLTQIEGDDLPALNGLIDRYGVVVIRDNMLSDEDMLTLARGLGEVYNAEGTEYYSPNGGVLRISNLDKDGKIKPRSLSSDANELWHTDSCFVKPRVTKSFLGSRVVTPVDGETQFCDTRVAYDLLTDDEKETLGRVVAHYSFLNSRARVGFDDWTPEQRKFFAGVERPLIHVHEPTGRMAIYLAAHIGRVNGYSEEDGRALIDDLIERATRPELIYTHIWRPGDLVIWDNRCTMHRARPYAYNRDPRDFRAVRLVDVTDR